MVQFFTPLTRFTPAKNSENYLICEKGFPPFLIVPQNFRYNAILIFFIYGDKQTVFLLGWMDSLSLYNQISFSEKSRSSNVRLTNSCGYPGRSQINNDRGSLIAIYEPQSSLGGVFQTITSSKLFIG